MLRSPTILLRQVLILNSSFSVGVSVRSAVSKSSLSKSILPFVGPRRVSLDLSSLARGVRVVYGR